MTASEVIGIVLLIAGFVLVGIEMAIPGFGLPGTGGIVKVETAECGIKLFHSGVIKQYRAGTCHQQRFQLPLRKIPDNDSCIGILTFERLKQNEKTLITGIVTEQHALTVVPDKTALN